MIKQYIYNVALACDQLVNAMLLGDPDESLSGRLGRAMESGRPKWWVPPSANIIDFLFRVVFRELDHVKNAIEPEENPYAKELWSWIKE